MLVPAFSSSVLSKHKCLLLIFLHTRIVCMSVKTSLLFYFCLLIDFSGTTRILILVFFYRIYCSLTEALGLSVSIVL